MDLRRVVWCAASMLLVGCGGIVESLGSAGASPGAGGEGITLGGQGGQSGRGGQGGSFSLSLSGAGGGCPDLAGPKLVQVAGSFCMDSTEVTRAQYQAWLQSAPSSRDQPPYCAWNTSFSSWCSGADPANVGPNAPQVCVNWCDAYAYCKGVGKRLCGKRGGGSLAYDAYDDPAQSQWDDACTSGGRNRYTYGSRFDAGACQIEGSPSDVGSHPACQSSVDGFRGIFDLSGNAAEWEDACDGATGPDDACRTRGGGISGVIPDQTSACDADGAGGFRGDGLSDVGFRCCWP